MKVGVDRIKFGRMVVTVAELAEIKEASWVSVMFVLFCRGYKPIKGGSLPLIPKLHDNEHPFERVRG